MTAVPASAEPLAVQPPAQQAASDIPYQALFLEPQFRATTWAREDDDEDGQDVPGPVAPRGRSPQFGRGAR